MKTSTCLIALCSLALSPAVLQAHEQDDLDQAAVTLNSHAATNHGTRHVLTAISEETGVPIRTLESQRAATRYGYGELLIANALAGASNRSFDQIVALRSSGEGWGRIAKDLGLKLGPIVSKAHRADEATLHGKRGKGHDDDSELDNGPGHGNGIDHGHGNMGHGHGHGPGGGS
ncbi:MAG: hypothetical protein ABJB32_00045 [Verrucomicrobiota bacterium]